MNKETEFIRKLVDTADTLAVNIDQIGVEAEKMLHSLVAKTKAGDTPSSMEKEIQEYVTITSDSILMQHQMAKTLSQVAVLYRFCKSFGIELELDENQVRKLEFLVQDGSEMFTVNEGVVSKAKNPAMDKYDEVLRQKTDIEDFIARLKATPLYNAE
jgi:hypothetical protein